MATNPTLAQMLQFIDAYQQQRPHQSSRAIARELRAYTKPGYASKFWEAVAGDNPDFVQGTLNNEAVTIAEEAVDFAHLIAALSDQFMGGNVISWVADRYFLIRSKLFRDLPYDTREFTAAIGDTAQPIEVYLSKYGSTTYNPEQLAILLRGLASEKDYASDLIAFAIGRKIQAHPTMTIAAAIAQVDELPYPSIVRHYIETSLGGRINPTQGVVTNTTEVKARIQARVRTYLLYARDAAKESIFNTTYRKQIKPALVNQATLYFWDYLLRKGKLSPP